MYQKTISVFVGIVAFLIFAVYAKADISDMQIPSQDFIVAEEAGNELCPECVSFDLRGVDIRSVLQILAYKSGMNIVASPEVEGLVTLKLDNVPWREALDVVLSMHGFDYEQKGSVITVTTVERLRTLRHNALLLADQEALTTKTLVLNYASAREVISSLERMLTPRGNLTYNQRMNAIIITDTISNVRSVKDVVNRLDTPTPQVLIEAKIIQTLLTDTEKFGVDWTATASALGPTSSLPINRPFGPPSFGTLDFSSFEAVLDMLQTRDNTETLSNPRLVTLDNETAKILVGIEYPFPDYRFNDDTGRFIIDGWDFKEIGVVFEITPQINSAGYVTLQVDPKVSAVDGQVRIEGTDFPVVRTEEASTRVRIKDGQTLMIAGLIKSDFSDAVKKLPILGDIPLLGLVFRRTDKTIERTELIIFITPHILVDDYFDQKDLLQEKKDSLKVRVK